jgi:hypothetical protein
MISLQSMRGHKHLKWPIRIGFGAIIVSFIFFYGWKANSGNNGRQQVDFAKVRSESWLPGQRWDYIGAVEMKRGEEQAMNKLVSQFVSRRALSAMNPSFLKGVVTNAEKKAEAANIVLGLRASERMGARVSLDDITQALIQQPGMSQEMFESMAQQNGYTVEEYLDVMRETSQLSEAEGVIGLAAHASLFELWQEYQLGHERLTLQVAAYPVARFEKQVSVTQADLADYLAKHKSEFHVPAKRQYDYVKLSKADFKAKTRVTEEQVKTYYEQNHAKYAYLAGTRVDALIVPLSIDAPTSIARQALGVLTQARDQARASKDWAALALKVESTHPRFQVLSNATTANEWLSSETTGHSAEFLSAVGAVDKDQVSTPMLDQDRAIMFRVRERRAAGAIPLKDVHDRARADAIADEVQKAFQDAFTRWRALLDPSAVDASGERVQPIKQIADFAKAVGLRDELTTATGVDADVIAGIGALGSAIREYVSSSLNPGELSDVIQLSDALVVMQARNQVDGYDPTLAQVRPQVEKGIRGQKAVDLARVAAQQNLEIVRGGADFKTVLADAPIKPFSPPPLRRSDQVQGLNGQLLDFIEKSVALKAGDVGVSPYGANAQNPVGFAVWKVTSIAEPTKAAFARDRLQFEAAYVQLQRVSMQEEWLADLRREAEYQPIESER